MKLDNGKTGFIIRFFLPLFILESFHKKSFSFLSLTKTLEYMLPEEEFGAHFHSLAGKTPQTIKFLLLVITLS